MYGEPIVQTRVAECMLASRATNPGSRRNGCKAYPAVDVAVSFPIQVVVYSSFREVALLINMLVVTHTHKITTHTHKITKKEILSFLTFFFESSPIQSTVTASTYIHVDAEPPPPTYATTRCIKSVYRKVRLVLGESLVYNRSRLLVPFSTTPLTIEPPLSHSCTVTPLRDLVLLCRVVSPRLLNNLLVARVLRISACVRLSALRRLNIT